MTTTPEVCPITTPDLKPCPFCGGKAILGRGEKGERWVWCGSCGVRTRKFSEGPTIEYRPNCFTSTDNLLAARSWNSRPCEGTDACPECGVAVPHYHEQRVKLSNRLFAGEKGTFVILTNTRNPNATRR